MMVAKYLLAFYLCDFFAMVFIILQGVLHWVAEPSSGVDPLKVEVRLFDKLFLSEVRNYLISKVLSLSIYIS